jgi:hypothetical protein
MDIVIGVLCAAIVIGGASLLGRSLDRAARRAHDAKSDDVKDDGVLDGEF